MCENRSEEYTCVRKLDQKSPGNLKEIKQLKVGRKSASMVFFLFRKNYFWLNIMAQKAGLAPNCWFRIPAIY
jgi:hypothetical protein